MTNNQNTTTQVLGKSIMMALLIIPTAISIFLTIQVRNIESRNVDTEIEVICFADNDCAIEAFGKVYRIKEVVILDEVIPDHFLLEAPEEEEKSPPALKSNKPTE